MKIQFYLRFHTNYGESLLISGNCDALGNGSPENALAMQYLNDEFWTATFELGKDFEHVLQYNYVLRTAAGDLVPEWGNDRRLEVMKMESSDITLVDVWNHAGEFDNVFFTQPFQEVLLPAPKKARVRSYKNSTHVFKVKAPLLLEHEVLCMLGSSETMGNWSEASPVLMAREENWWVVRLNLSGQTFPIAYKYGVYNTKTKKFGIYENGSNRMLYDAPATGKITLLHDGFAQLPNNTWHGAGVAIPVFSLRSKKSFGVGEFTDMKLLADWAHKVQMRLIQILPINDTTATHTWVDSYPYAAISAFALHPIYINVAQVAGGPTHPVIQSYAKQQAELNALPDMDYERVMQYKWEILRQLYTEQKQDLHDDLGFSEFFNRNRHWLVPYAVFSYLRDKYHTPDFTQWKELSVYNEHEVLEYADPGTKYYDEIAIYYFVQYHLHLQLKDATAYAHKLGIIVKGDIPIGIYRNSCDAWVEPELYNMDMQAGAPPDDFAIKGQNWGFPTYNWERMAADGFSWWRKRFEQMSNYFDAFRIDHILGFFRIWSIPLDAVEGIMGYFVPAQPVHISEFGQRGMWFDYQRLCKPFITDAVLRELLGDDAHWLLGFMNPLSDGRYELKPEYNTQRKVEAHFRGQEQHERNERMKQALYDCISNVILLEVDGSQAQAFHFRISMSATSSFRYLDADMKGKLEDLYVNYFFRRQDEFWRKQAMAKLPALKRATNMLICGEDLGMVPECVPDVMNQLGILSLEIQRMPKDPKRTFFNPADAPYLSVVTPSTHDMSIIRGWWEEDRTKTQSFYNVEIGQYGTAPYYCEPWVVRTILTQHLYSPAMWSIFQLQELLGMSGELRRENPNDERINVPANPRHYWRYRMHFTLEQLLHEDAFNHELAGYITASGRA